MWWLLSLIAIVPLALYAALWLLSAWTWYRVRRNARRWAAQHPDEYRLVEERFRPDDYANGQPWYEQARISKWFQPPACRNVTARYSKSTPTELLLVDNRCGEGGGGLGRRSQASRGRARPVPGVAGAFGVTFMPRWLPPIWGSYTVVRIADETARSVAVSNPPHNDTWWWLTRSAERLPDTEMPDYPAITGDAKKRKLVERFM